MLTMVKVNNKNTRTMLCVFDFNYEHMQMNLFVFIVNFEHVFVSWAVIKSIKQLKVHIKQYGSFFKTCTCDMSKSIWFNYPANH